ncbi:hypothetical protein N7540_008797 [Penicillium herquei]|nr:hypothetical protein N7540_008797 [Penicillium herquei]
MKFTTVSLFLAASAAHANPLEPRSSGVQGFDISSYQDTVDFSGAYGAGARFVMIKATEGTTYIDFSFSSHYDGATSAGFIRGGYHFAHPDSSSGATQAEYFLAHGGGWTNDGITLPGMLDIEYNPSGSTCYGLSATDMVSWIQDFGETYQSKTGRYPMIYTTADWWSTCTGDSTAFGEDYPLVLAQYSSSISTVPGGWAYQSFWQNADSYTYGGDSDLWNGDETSLQTFAKGS